MQGATSGTWQRHQLYLATPTSVQLVFVATDTPGAEPFIEVGSLTQPLVGKFCKSASMSWSRFWLRYLARLAQQAWCDPARFHKRLL